MFIILITIPQFLLCLSLVRSSTTPTVTIHNGQISGIPKYGSKCFTFLGIPYAEPPVGYLRFRKSFPKRNWEGIYNASQFGPACIQLTRQNDSTTSEDCLFLNIWTPTLNIYAYLPVMMWIHGGGFIFGSSSDMDNGHSMFNGSQLCSEDVVVVTINYRLGCFGFLTDGSDDAPGNAAFWDQELALRWIRHNIRAFGGNYNDITIFGESAGSWSVSALVLSPITRYLFQKCIMQSGSLYHTRLLTDKKIGIKLSRKFAAYLNCTEDYKWIRCLQDRSANDLNLVQFGLFEIYPEYLLYLKPIYNDEFLPESPVQSFINGNFKTDVKCLLAHNEFEGLYPPQFIYKNDVVSEMNYNPQIPFAIDFNQRTAKNDIEFLTRINIPEISNLYTEGLDTNTYDELTLNILLRRSVVLALGDYILVCPTVLFGANMVRNPKFRGQIHQYRLTYGNSRSQTKGSVWANATHGDDLPFTFGRPLNEEGWSDYDKIMSEIFIKVLTFFAKYGYAQLYGKYWPPYSRSSDGLVNISYLEFNPEPDRSGTLFTNRYRGNDGYRTRVENNCLIFWQYILEKQYENNFNSLSEYSKC